jgi:hypothetical protein
MSSNLLDISISSRKKQYRGNKILASLNRKKRKEAEPKFIFIDETYLDYMASSYGNNSIKVNMFNEGRSPVKY